MIIATVNMNINHCIIIVFWKGGNLMEQTFDFGFSKKEIEEIEEIGVHLIVHACEGGSEGWAG